MYAKQIVILVVEDDEAVRDLLAAVLADKPHRTVTAVRHGAEALAFLEAVQPQLIILDATLPGIDGIALYKKIREREDLNDVPVLLLSGHDRDPTASLSGRCKWLTKPFDLDTLDASVDALLAEVMR